MPKDPLTQEEDQQHHHESPREHRPTYNIQNSLSIQKWTLIFLQSQYASNNLGSMVCQHVIMFVAVPNIHTWSWTKIPLPSPPPPLSLYNNSVFVSLHNCKSMNKTHGFQTLLDDLTSTSSEVYWGLYPSIGLHSCCRTSRWTRDIAPLSLVPQLQHYCYQDKIPAQEEDITWKKIYHGPRKSTL